MPKARARLREQGDHRPLPASPRRRGARPARTERASSPSLLGRTDGYDLRASFGLVRGRGLCPRPSFRRKVRSHGPQRGGQPVSPQGTIVENVRPFVEQVAADLGLAVYDLEHAGGMLRITSTVTGESTSRRSPTSLGWCRASSIMLDPFPGRYTLEVSSPGLERTLRTAGPFPARARQRRSRVRTHARCRGRSPGPRHADRGRRRDHHGARSTRATTVEQRARAMPTSSGPAPFSNGARRRRIPSAGKPRRNGAAPTTTRKAAT